MVVDSTCSSISSLWKRLTIFSSRMKGTKPISKTCTARFSSIEGRGMPMVMRKGKGSTANKSMILCGFWM